MIPFPSPQDKYSKAQLFNHETISKMVTKICLNMIVRDESHCVCRCLQNMCNSDGIPFIDCIAIVDTGSKDDTIDKINSWMTQHNVPGKVIEQPWENFGVNRTLALRHAEAVIETHKKKDEAWYILFMDADNEAWSNVEESVEVALTDAETADWIKVRKDSRFKWAEAEAKKNGKSIDDILAGMPAAEEPPKTKTVVKRLPFPLDKSKLTHDSYKADMKNGSVQYDYTWLVRYNPLKRFQWKAPCHEYVSELDNFKTNCGRLTGGWIHSGRDGGRSRSPAKYLKDAMAFEIALKEEKDPDVHRYTFYLAQSYRDANRKDLAAKHFLARGNMKSGWGEETYLSLYYAAQCRAEIGKTAIKDGKIVNPKTFYKTMDILYRAYEVRPHRLEAPYMIVQLYRWAHLYNMGWSFGRTLLALSYPKDDILFVNMHIHRSGFRDEVALCGFYCNQRELAKKIWDALLLDPQLTGKDRKHIQNNLDYCKKALGM